MTLPHNDIDHVAVAIVGGGPAGLTAAATLAPLVDGKVLVIEREAETGGIPRHSDHPGYGIRDLRRSISGPTYARRLTDSARDAGAQLATEAMVTGWSGERDLQVTSPRGRRVVRADAVVLATGARERPRPARLIPGDRPDGVYTTGQLQNLVHLHHADVGRRAVIVGAELVSWSAVLTLRDAGCATVAMLSSYPAAEAYAAFRLPGRFLLAGPVLTRTRVVSITGKHRVESVTIENLDTGTRSTIACDTVVTTGDWIPDHELARTGGLVIDPGTRGPLVDAALRTSADGVFAVGNLLHPVDTADIAALDGKHVAAAVTAYLRGVPAPADGVRLLVDPPLRWIS
ncbi:MAG: FAD-dependent oxidoreductase, partial [Mycobacterium sp.]